MSIPIAKKWMTLAIAISAGCTAGLVMAQGVPRTDDILSGGERLSQMSVAAILGAALLLALVVIGMMAFYITTRMMAQVDKCIRTMQAAQDTMSGVSQVTGKAATEISQAIIQCRMIQERRLLHSPA